MLAHFQSKIREDTGAESEKPLHKLSVQIRDILAHFRSFKSKKKLRMNPRTKTTNPGMTTQTRQISSWRRSGLKGRSAAGFGRRKERDRGQQQQQQRQRKTDGGSNNDGGNQLLCDGLLSFLDLEEAAYNGVIWTASASAQLQGKIFMLNRRVGRGLDSFTSDIAPGTQNRRLKETQNSVFL